MLDEVILKLIMLCHYAIILCVVGIPFTSNNYLLVMHFICVPFMMGHWYMNDNTCALTMIEIELRRKLGYNVNKDECFTCQLIEPVYDFKANNKEWETYLYVISTCLWLITTYKLFSMYARGEIYTMHDLLFKTNTTKLFGY